MKTRKQIIDEILEKSRKEANLESALKAMQDAILFSLAQDLEISLEEVQS